MELKLSDSFKEFAIAANAVQLALMHDMQLLVKEELKGFTLDGIKIVDEIDVLPNGGYRVSVFLREKTDPYASEIFNAEKILRKYVNDNRSYIEKVIVGNSLSFDYGY